jgi:hypothetical protein
MLLTCTSFGPVNYGTINEKPGSLRQGPVVVFTTHVPAKAEENVIFFNARCRSTRIPSTYKGKLRVN